MTSATRRRIQALLLVAAIVLAFAGARDVWE